MISDSMTINRHYDVKTISNSFNIEKLSGRYALIEKHRDSLHQILEYDHSLLGNQIDTLAKNLLELQTLTENFDKEYAPIVKARQYQTLAESTADFHLRSQLFQLVQVEKRNAESIIRLKNDIGTLLDFFRTWKNDKVGNILAGQDTTNRTSSIRDEYEALLYAQQNIDNKIYLFEDLYNRKRNHTGATQPAELLLDPFYIEIQDYIYNKYVLRKPIYNSSFFLFKDKLTQTAIRVEDCMERINRIYLIDETFRKNTIHWQLLAERYEVVKQLCQQGKFTIENDVRFHLQGNDSTAYHVSPMAELPSINSGLQTGFEWAVIPIKSGMRSMKIVASLTLRDSINKQEIPVTVIQKVPVRVFRDKIWVSVSRSKPRRSQEE